MREGQGVAREVGAGADERDLRVEAAFGIAREEEALLLAVRLVKDDEPARGLGGLRPGRPGGQVHGSPERQKEQAIPHGVVTGFQPADDHDGRIPEAVPGAVDFYQPASGAARGPDPR